MPGGSNGPGDFESRPKNDKKRPYIFSYGKARRCTHPMLKEVAIGAGLYRCLRCNYAFWIQSATMWPLHFIPIMAAFEIMEFVREFGIEALEKVYRTPIGQYDGTDHKAPLPPGKTFVDVLREMEGVDAYKLAHNLPLPQTIADSILKELDTGERDGVSSDKSEVPRLPTG